MFKKSLLRTASVLAQTAPAILFGIFPASQALAGPEGGNVVAGSAQITSGTNRVDIHQSSQRAVIDWRTFDVGVGETTQFHQPNSQSLTLNRVGTGGASQIDGQLKANGNIVIVNPNGVFFGAGSKVDVNGLVATTADIDNDRFMADDKPVFDKPGNPNAAIVNEGTITAKEAGLVGLVAPNVVNNGVIAVRLGRVHLASGDTTTVDFYGNGLMEVQVSDEVASQLVSNGGIIHAEGGTIAITAAAGKDVVNSLVTVGGELHAPTVGVHEGKIIIAAEGSNAVAGNVEADKGQKSGSSTVLVSAVLDVAGRDAGEKGGSIEITGDNIALLNGTLIDASGHSAPSAAVSGSATLTADKQVRTEAEFLAQQSRAGGSIKIGGDYLGGGVTPTAKNLYVDTGVYVFNDAVESGDAGRTVFWSDGTTDFYGNVFARGGDSHGHGGFLETSGKSILRVRGFADLTAVNGSKGTYLLDPDKIAIYGGVDPEFTSSDSEIDIASDLLFWVDADDASTVTLTYSTNGLSGITASGTQDATSITVSASVAASLQAGARIRLGSAGSVDTADTLGTDTYTIASIDGTTVYLTSALTTDYSGSQVYRGLVSTWADKAGSNDASITGDANMPLYLETGMNGQGALYFNSEYNRLVSTLTISGDATVFATFNPLQVASGDSHIFGTASLSGTYTGGFAQLSQSWNDPTYATGAGYASGMSTSRWTLGTVNNSGYGYGGTGFGDKITSVIFYGSPVSSNTFTIGNRYSNNNPSNSYYGTQSEIVILSGAASAEVRNLIDQYQSTKYSVALLSADPATEASLAMDVSTGYSAFTVEYLEYLSQSADIVLQASNGITLDFNGDTLNLADDKSIHLTTDAGGITAISAGGIETTRTGTGGNIQMTATGTGGLIDLTAFTLTSNSGDITLTASGAITTQTIDTAGNATITATGGTYTSLGKIGDSAALNDLTVSSRDISLQDTVKGTGTLTLQQDANNRALHIGTGTIIGGYTSDGSNAFYLDSDEVARLLSDWDNVAIGRTGTSADTFIGTITSQNDLTIRSGYRITLGTGHTLSTANASSFTVDSSWIDLYGDIASDGDVTINTSSSARGTTARSGVTVSANDADITFNGSYDLRDGGGNINAGTGTVTFNSTINQSAGNMPFNVTAGTIDFAYALSHSGNSVNISGASVTLTSGGDLILPVMSVYSLTASTANLYSDIRLNQNGGTIAVASGGFLHLNANYDIEDLSGGNITTSGSGYFLFEAGNEIRLDAGQHLTANAGGTTFQAVGEIRLQDGSLTSQAGDVILNADRNGTGGRVVIDDFAVETNGGDIVLGGGTDPYNDYVTHATGTAIWVSNAATLTTYSGDIYLSGHHTSNVVQGGVYISGGANISSTEGDILIDGKGTGNIGVVLSGSGTTLSNQDGDIIINAHNDAAGGIAMNNWGTTIIESTGEGDIQLNMLRGYYYSASGSPQRVGSTDMTGDIYLHTTVITSYMDNPGAYNFITQGTLYISAPDLRSIHIGDSSAGGTLVLSDAALNNFHASAYVFGSETSGNVSVRTTHDFGDADVSFISGQDINIYSTLTKSTGSAIVDYLFQADGNIYSSNEADILALNGAGGFNLTLNADYDQASNAGGAIKLVGTDITTGGGFVVMGGGTAPQTMYAIGAVDNSYDSGIYFNGVNINAGAGDITLNGQGETTGADNYGFNLISSSFTTTTGDITLNVRGGVSGTQNNYGVRLRNGVTFTTTGTQDGEGDITINAEGGSGSTAILLCNNNSCTDPGPAATFNTAAGDILWNINAPGSGERVEMNSPLVVDTESGDFTIRTTGTIQGGIVGSSITTSSGDITFHSDSNSVSGGGINLANFAITTDSGDVVLGGGADARTGYAKGTSANGVELVDIDITTGSGDIIIHGEGEDTDQYNYGVNIRNGTILTTDDGDILIYGRGGNGTNRNYGIGIGASTGVHNQILTQSGAITLYGEGRGNGERNYGVEILGVIRSLGSAENPGDITITGISSTSTSSARGIQFSGLGSTITTVNADIYLNGEGDQRAIFIDDDARISSYGTTEHAGRITLTGIAGGATGGKGIVGISTRSIIESYVGDITLSGTSITSAGAALSIDDRANIRSLGSANILLQGAAPNSSDEAIYISDDSTTIGHADMTGDITITGNSLYLDAATTNNLRTQGTLTIQPLTAGTQVYIGSESGGLSLSNEELSRMNAGAYVFGSMESGDVTVQTSRDFGDADVSFLSGQDIILASTLTKATGSAIADYLFRADRDIYNTGNSGIIAQSGFGGFNLTLNSDYDQSVNPTGAIRFNGGTITTGDGNLVMGGGTDPVTTNTYGNTAQASGYVSGIDLRGGFSAHAGAGDILLNGGAVNSNGSSYGIQLYGVAFDTTTGSITVNGTGNTVGAPGIRFLNNVRFTTTGTNDGEGNVTLHGSSNSVNGALWFCNTSSCTGAGNSATITTSAGDVLIDTTTGTAQTINIINPLVITTGTGDVTFRANDNIRLGGGSITTDGGDVTFNSDRDVSVNVGGAISLTNVDIITSGGNVTFGGGLDPVNGNATGRTDGTYDSGVYLNGVDISSDEGDITLHAYGDITNGNNYGINLIGGSFATTTGNIYLRGQGGNSTSGVTTNYGILLSDDVHFTTTGGEGTGNITLIGQGSGSSSAIRFCNTGTSCPNTGNAASFTTSGGDILVNSTSTYWATLGRLQGVNAIDIVTDTGDVTFRTNGNIELSGSITTDEGNVTLNADRDQASYAGGTVSLSNLQITTGEGDVVIGGGTSPETTATSGYDAHGVQISGTSYIHTGGGDISIRGAAGGTGPLYAGVIFNPVSTGGAAILSTTGNGSITIEGSSTSSGAGSYGVALNGASENVLFETENGAITITGIGSSAAGASAAHGIRLRGQTEITSTAGDIIFYASNGSTGNAFSVDGTNHTIGGIGYDGDITFNINNQTTSSGHYATVQTLGKLTIRPWQDGRAMRIGGVTSGALSLSNDVMANLFAGEYEFGSLTTGAMEISTVKDFADADVTFLSNSNMTLTSTLTKNSGSAMVNYLFRTNNNIANDLSAGIIATTGMGGFNLTLNSDYDQATNPGGKIKFQDGSIITGGGDVIMGGGTDPRTTSTWGTNGIGIHFHGLSSTISTGDGDIIMNGYVAGTNDQTHGIALSRDADNGIPLLQTTGGDIILNGSSDASADGSYGISISGDLYLLTLQTVDGDIIINGTGSPNANVLGHGIRIKNNVEITSVNGDITLIASAPSGNGNGINISQDNNTIGGSGMLGDITIIADDWSRFLTVETAGALTIAPYSTGGTVAIGSNASGFLNFADNYLALLSAGSYTFGSATTGAIEIDTNHSFDAPVTFLTGAGYDITLGSALSSSVASGTAVVLASGGDFINQAGSSALNLQSGARWLIYSANPVDNLRDGLLPTASLFGQTYATNTPASLSGTAGNLFLYSTTTRPVLNFDLADVTLTYGDALSGNATLQYLSGLAGDDTLANIGWNGAAALTSATYQPTTYAGLYTNALTASAGSYVSPLGYLITFRTADIRVNKAVLNVTLADPNPSRYQRSVNPAFPLLFSGWKNSDGLSALAVLPVATSSATLTSPVGSYNIVINGGSAANYTFSYPAIAGQLHVVEGVGSGFVLPDTVSKTTQSNLATRPVQVVETVTAPPSTSSTQGAGETTASSDSGGEDTGSPRAQGRSIRSLIEGLNGLIQIDPRLSNLLGLSNPFK